MNDEGMLNWSEAVGASSQRERLQFFIWWRLEAMLASNFRFPMIECTFELILIMSDNFR